MAAPITVPATFKAEFDEFCRRLEMTTVEIANMRQDIRADFATVGAWVTETVMVYRFCDATWGTLPTPDLCEGYLASKGWWPADPLMFKKMGIMLLAKLCAQVGGAIPAPPAPGG